MFFFLAASAISISATMASSADRLPSYSFCAASACAAGSIGAPAIVELLDRDRRDRQRGAARRRAVGLLGRGR